MSASHPRSGAFVAQLRDMSRALARAKRKRAFSGGRFVRQIVTEGLRVCHLKGAWLQKMILDRDYSLVASANPVCSQNLRNSPYTFYGPGEICSIPGPLESLG